MDLKACSAHQCTPTINLTSPNNKPYLPVLSFVLLNNLKLICLQCFCPHHQLATDSFRAQHQESSLKRGSGSEDPSKNLHDTVLVSPESEKTGWISDVAPGITVGIHQKKHPDLSTSYHATLDDEPLDFDGVAMKKEEKNKMTDWWFGCHLDYFPIY